MYAIHVEEKNRYSCTTCYPDVIWDMTTQALNTLRIRQNGLHFPGNIFKCIFLNENVWNLIEISLKFVPKGPINNIPAMVQIMAQCLAGAKPLSEPIMVSLLMHIYVTRPQWVKVKQSNLVYQNSYIFGFQICIIDKLYDILNRNTKCNFSQCKKKRRTDFYNPNHVTCSCCKCKPNHHALDAVGCRYNATTQC